MATCAHRYGRQVHVFEPHLTAPMPDTFVCISQFGSASTTDISLIYVLYRGRCHYDLLVPRAEDLPDLSPRTRDFRTRLASETGGQQNVGREHNLSFPEGVVHVDLTEQDEADTTTWQADSTGPPVREGPGEAAARNNETASTDEHNADEERYENP